MIKIKTNKVISLERILVITIVSALFICILIMIGTINKIQGTAKVVNYVSTVRDGSQRLVKLEMAGIKSDNLEKEVSDTLYALTNSETEDDLATLDDASFQKSLTELSNHWIELTEEIEKCRANGASNSNILTVSEVFYNLSNSAVIDAEEYSEHLTNRLEKLERGLITSIIMLLLYLLFKTYRNVTLSKKQLELSEKAYIDLHTGIPNKSRCNEVLIEKNAIITSTCLIMFDLNNLKVVNDTLGHIAGDSLISDFAAVLKHSVPDTEFIGRFGGDEFLVILENKEDNEIDLIIDNIATEVTIYNSFGHSYQIAYACGFAKSKDYQECSMQTLLDKADQNMYLNKQALKGLLE